jgi:hypothetical protein
MKSLLVVLFFLIVVPNTSAQTISASIPKEVKPGEKYVFYLHGAIIESQGINAVSPYWGRYEYTAILDTLRSHGYNVISEARPQNTDAVEYANKVAKEISVLLASGVSPENIIVVGASAGGSIAVDISIRVKNSKIKYVVLGVCRWAKWKAYLHENALCGNFLSIYESSDSYGSCEGYFNEQVCISGYKEIKLNMNNGHGFLYKPYREWVHPLVKWINGQEDDAKEMSQENNDYDSNRKAEDGSIKNQYDSTTIHGDKIVIDHATDLIWQQAGSDTEMTFEDARQFVNNLNARGFAGHKDWRLPTLQEALSLIEARKNESGLYIDPIFDNKQRWIWTADKESALQVRLVNFLYGFNGSFHPDYTIYVRCVR